MTPASSHRHSQSDTTGRLNSSSSSALPPHGNSNFRFPDSTAGDLGGRRQYAPPRGQYTEFDSAGLPLPPPVPSSQMSGAPRSQSYGRQVDDMLGSSNYSQMGQQQQQQQQQQGPYGASHDPGRAGSGSSLPGALQAGRPGPTSANTAPSAVPTLPPLATAQQATPSRGAGSLSSHNYSRSSPNAPYIEDTSKYSSPPSHKYISAPTTQTSSHSPLGLADIRPRADSSVSDGPNAAPYQDYPTEATNCSYLAPWAVYAFDWCKWSVQEQGIGDSAGKMAVGSYLEDGHNYIQILDTHVVPDPDPESETGAPQYGIEYTKVAEAAHSYPVTRILWEPETQEKQSCDLLATSGDHLRLWSLPPVKNYNASNSITRSANIGADGNVQKLTPLALLSNSKSPEHTAPLTSLDWNTLSPSLIITSSIDTTCTIWDIPSLTAKTQLIAHDKEVFDVRFCANSVDVFVSCGADGSVRMFDLRSLEHSTIIYEPSEKGDKSASPGDISPTKAQQTMSHAPPLLRLAASPYDVHHLATFSQESNSIRVLDVRQPGQALLELTGHCAPINCMEWSPSRRGTLASGGDDSLVLIWDLLNQGPSSTPSSTLSSSGAPASNGGAGAGGAATAGTAAVAGAAGGVNSDSARTPAASWQCDYEVNNLSWAPQSALTAGHGHGHGGGAGADWLAVSAGRGIWAVSL